MEREELIKQISELTSELKKREDNYIILINPSDEKEVFYSGLNGFNLILFQMIVKLLNSVPALKHIVAEYVLHELKELSTLARSVPKGHT